MLSPWQETTWPKLSRTGAKYTDYVKKVSHLKNKAWEKRGEDASQILASLINPSSCSRLHSSSPGKALQIPLIQTLFLSLWFCSSVLLIPSSHIHTAPWLLTTALLQYPKDPSPLNLIFTFFILAFSNAMLFPTCTRVEDELISNLLL